MERKIIIFLSLFSLLVILRLVYFYGYKAPIKEGRVDYETRIVSSPKIYGLYQSFAADYYNEGIVLIKTKPDLILSYGDKVRIVGNLEYRLLKDNTQVLVINYPNISLENHTDNLILALTNKVRQQISRVFYANLPKDMAGLLLGIVVGVKSDFSPQFFNNLKLSGVMHVIAASGLNVTMVGGFFFFVFSSILKRQWAIVIAISAIIFYGFLAGFQPSIIRACIMGIILFASQITGRQVFSFYSLVITFFAMLIIFPQFLFDVGFQLSFVSTLGLLFIPPLFKKLNNFVTDDLITTVSAQIASLPILLFNFGTYSIWSIVANFLVLWTIPPLMIFGGLAAVLSLLFSPLAKYILFLCLPLLAYFETIISYFASLEGRIEVNVFPMSLLLGYYLLLFSLLGFVYIRNNRS